MKKMFISLATIAIAASSITSCKSPSTTFSDRAPATTMYPAVSPMIADLEVSPKKVTFREEYEVKDQTFSFTSTGKEALVKNAIAALLRDNNADVLMYPQSEVITIVPGNKEKKKGGKYEGKKKLYEIVVSGYPAVYKNIRPMPKNSIKATKLEDVPYLITTEDSEGGVKSYNVENKKASGIDLSNTKVDGLDKITFSTKGSDKK